MTPQPLLDPQERRWLWWAMALTVSLIALVVFWGLRLSGQVLSQTYLTTLSIVGFAGLTAPLGVWAFWQKLHRAALERDADDEPTTPNAAPPTPASLPARTLTVRLLHSPDAEDEARQIADRLQELPGRCETAAPCVADILTDADPSPPAQVIIAVLGWRLAGEGTAAQTPWHCLAETQAQADHRADAPRLLLYRRAGRPPLDHLPDAQVEPALHRWRDFNAWANGLFPPCPSAADPGPQAGPCWRDYAPEQASALAARVLDDLTPLARQLARPAAPDLPPGAAADPSRPGQGAAARRWKGSPFLGLVALQFFEADIFCGRGTQVDDLLRALRQPGRWFLPVIGASGAGKSSLVWAGLLPRLAGGALPGSAAWVWVRCTPAEEAGDPFLALAKALVDKPELARCRFGTARFLAQRLRNEGLPAVVATALKHAADPDQFRLLLFIDQFEELFGLPVAGRDAFIDLLAAGAAGEDGPAAGGGQPRLLVVVTMRNEFAGQVAEHPRLAALFSQGTYWLAPPGEADRLAMIQGPAHRAGLQLEVSTRGDLARQIVQETGDAPGRLALMAYTLEQLNRPDPALPPPLTFARYDALGGVEGVISARAEAVLADGADDPADADRALGALFRRLVDLRAADAPPTRKRATWADLAAADGADPDGALALARRLEAARLLVTGGAEAPRRQPAGADPTAPLAALPGAAVVEVAHEALLTCWPRLKAWLDARRNQLWQRGRLALEAADWAHNGCRHRDVPSPERAADLRAALAVLDEQPNDCEEAFLDPAVRARWLLARDLAAWQQAGAGGQGLWDADRFSNFAVLEPAAAATGQMPAPEAPAPVPPPAPPLLPAPTPAERRFLLRSFEQVLADHPQEPRLRARCGDALAALGDLRFDPARWWLPDDDHCGFREVPAGAFLMGSRPGEGWDNEEPQHELPLPTFWIARWPVTVAQFRAYIDARGKPPTDPMSLQRPPNQPVVLITWYEARDYATWLGARLAERAPAWAADTGLAEDARRLWRAVAAGTLRLGLPSEAEWEKAARGPAEPGKGARRYPWGDGITPALANYQATGFGRPCAVGVFPAGAGPYGCEDQAGNVWEWTRSLWGPYSDLENPAFRYPYDRDDGREAPEAERGMARVLRGGSFADDAHYCRAAVRCRGHPHNRDVISGVRLAWSPFL